jgi:hypothetical protein
MPGSQPVSALPVDDVRPCRTISTTVISRLYGSRARTAAVHPRDST